MPTETDRGATITVKTALDGEEISFRGIELGFGTSHRDSHTHPLSRYASRGDRQTRAERCSGCRWTETRIFRNLENDQYVISIVGRSIVPKESDRLRAIWAKQADDVIDALLVPPPAHTGRTTPLELPQPSRDALVDAAEDDEELALAFTTYERE